MRVKTAVRRICRHCFTVRRKGRLYVYCKDNPRHKQRQIGGKKKYSTLSALPPTQSLQLSGLRELP
eukprot:5529291-Prorocentrum_lima.AAC.1